MKTAVKVPIQKTSVYQTVTRQNAVILPPILFAVHLETIRNKNSKKHTALSRYTWQLKDKKIQHEIQWSIKSRATPYVGGARWCDLCLSEKLAILFADKKTALNSKSEILGKCRHKRKFCLENVRR